MLSLVTVEPDTLELLKNLMQEKLLANTRLVGGTALALQYGHRNSVDLDFFGEIDPEEDYITMLKQYGNVMVIKNSSTIKQFIVNGVKVDIVNYKYPWIDNPVEEDGIILASPKDIAAMKINAVEGRGSKKDFIDIYFLLQKYHLSEILEFYSRKYPEYSIFRAMMSLTYFDDADEQVMPKMFEDVSWEHIKNSIKKIVSNI